MEKTSLETDDRIQIFLPVCNSFPSCTRREGTTSPREHPIKLFCHHSDFEVDRELRGALVAFWSVLTHTPSTDRPTLGMGAGAGEGGKK